MTPIQKAVEIAGGQNRLAEQIGVSHSFINQCLKGVRPIPAIRCRDIEIATGGEVTRAQLRPDIYGELHDQEAGRG